VKITVVACLLLVACGAAGRTARSPSPSLPVDWSVHEQAGLRIAAPTAWGPPQLLKGSDASGAPRAWVVFRDPSGAEALTIMTWRDTTAAAVAAAQYGSELPQGDRTDVTLGQREQSTGDRCHRLRAVARCDRERNLRMPASLRSDRGGVRRRRHRLRRAH